MEVEERIAQIKAKLYMKNEYGYEHQVTGAKQ